MKKILIPLLLLVVWLPTVSAQQAKLAPGLDVVGFGYDVFGEYANQKSKLSRQLFEFGEYTQRPIGAQLFRVPNGVLFEHMADHKIKKANGSSIREYSKNLAVKAGIGIDAMVFSASVESQFGKRETKTEQRFYSTYLDVNTKWRVSLDAITEADLKGMLSASARNHINNLDPSELFRTYGTHFIYSAYLGGRADFSTVTVIKKKTSQQDIDIAIEAKYQSVTGKTSINKQVRSANKDISVTAKTRVLGGNSHKINNITNPQMYAEWADGIIDMPVLCDFDKNSLRPIWTLADRPERRSQLENAFKLLCQQHPLPAPIANIIQMELSLYHIRPKNSDKYIDVQGFYTGAMGTNKKVELWNLDTGADRFIKIKPSKKAPQWVMLQPQHDNVVFQVGSSEERVSGSLTTNRPSEKDNQLFRLTPVDGEKNTYTIRNKQSDLVLTYNPETANTNGGQIALENFRTEDETQWWIFEEANTRKLQPDFRYLHFVRAEKSEKFWDAPGYGLNAQMKGVQMCLWGQDNTPDRYMKFQPIPHQEGWFGIEPYHSPYFFDINSKNKVILWKNHKGNNQQFTFEWAGEPNVFFIKVKSNGLYIDAENGGINQNGCGLQVHKFNGSQAQRWLLVNTRKKDTKHIIGRKFYVKVKGTKKYWDIPGRGNETKGRNKPIKIWDLDNGKDRIFEFIPADDHEYWYIKNMADGKFVDIGGYWKLTDMGRIDQAKYRAGKRNKKKKTDKGAEVQVWDKLNKSNQKFKIVHLNDNTVMFICKHSGKAIDVAGGHINKNGTKLIQWDSHKGAPQQFQLIYAEGKHKGKTYTVR